MDHDFFSEQIFVKSPYIRPDIAIYSTRAPETRFFFAKNFAFRLYISEPHPASQSDVAYYVTS